MAEGGHVSEPMTLSEMAGVPAGAYISDSLVGALISDGFRENDRALRERRLVAEQEARQRAKVISEVAALREIAAAPKRTLDQVADDVAWKVGGRKHMGYFTNQAQHAAIGLDKVTGTTLNTTNYEVVFQDDGGVHVPAGKPMPPDSVMKHLLDCNLSRIAALKEMKRLSEPTPEQLCEEHRKKYDGKWYGADALGTLTGRIAAQTDIRKALKNDAWSPDLGGAQDFYTILEAIGTQRIVAIETDDGEDYTTYVCIPYRLILTARSYGPRDRFDVHLEVYDLADKCIERIAINNGDDVTLTVLEAPADATIKRNTRTVLGAVTDARNGF
jgi:hypothetical protein